MGLNRIVGPGDMFSFVLGWHVYGLVGSTGPAGNVL